MRLYCTKCAAIYDAPKNKPELKCLKCNAPLEDAIAAEKRGGSTWWPGGAGPVGSGKQN